MLGYIMVVSDHDFDDLGMERGVLSAWPKFATQAATLTPAPAWTTS
ncbi:hypothetical protein HAPAU_34050 [Halalkalicoccus paucihalophilus]|uniref:Uncharacterized protein n=1 Tax=Halalkalicoccus paucihalophilus TaxID=1008153 RepID=A0A151AA98_9EURY|nr:hypothetical protein HAPAU_34050 [Halalkalicoccus paucihalophilus]